MATRAYRVRFGEKELAGMDDPPYCGLYSTNVWGFLVLVRCDGELYLSELPLSSV